ncbi:MAG: sigma-54-dependent Fis family transcriptional regulator [Ignavibacteriae bacterium]|nr:sigma-54-dependent Fis family transcriptional regulator [Ignavibacteriota bacterium]
MKASILLVDDEQNILKTVGIALGASGYDVTSFLHPLQALEAMRVDHFDIGLFDLKMEPLSGIDLLREARTLAPEMTVVLMTAHGSIDSAVEAMKLGAYDYLQKPFEFSELQLFIDKVASHHHMKSELRQLKEELARRGGTGSLVTRSERMKSLIALALQVADSSIAVLVEGESGTGKELLAHLIHDSSPRKDRPFVTVNCSALAENLLESELFGHVKGSFTGAVRDRQGRFEAADGGTVFLDEIGEIPPPTQVKLLRFLQHKEFERVGETATSKVDVRVLAATNRDLQAAVENGQFREDLYYRLNAVKLKLPPLRERQEDIPLLAQHFLTKLGANTDVAPQVMAALSGYGWKGNVRELENVMERAVILARGEPVQLYHLPEEFQTLATPASRPMSLEEVEQQHIIKVLRLAKDLDEAATILGIDPATLYRKRKKYGL